MDKTQYWEDFKKWKQVATEQDSQKLFQNLANKINQEPYFFILQKNKMLAELSRALMLANDLKLMIKYANGLPETFAEPLWSHYESLLISTLQQAKNRKYYEKLAQNINQINKQHPIFQEKLRQFIVTTKQNFPAKRALIEELNGVKLD